MRERKIDERFPRFLPILNIFRLLVDVFRRREIADAFNTAMNRFFVVSLPIEARIFSSEGKRSM